MKRNKQFEYKLMVFNIYQSVVAILHLLILRFTFIQRNTASHVGIIFIISLHLPFSPLLSVRICWKRMRTHSFVRYPRQTLINREYYSLYSLFSTLLDDLEMQTCTGTHTHTFCMYMYMLCLHMNYVIYKWIYNVEWGCTFMIRFNGCFASFDLRVPVSMYCNSMRKHIFCCRISIVIATNSTFIADLFSYWFKQ